jgi:hypothetical protein
MNDNYFVLIDTEGRIIADFNTRKRAWIHFKSLINSGLKCKLKILNAEQIDGLMIEDLKRKAKNYSK